MSVKTALHVHSLLLNMYLCSDEDGYGEINCRVVYVNISLSLRVEISFLEIYQEFSVK